MSSHKALYNYTSKTGSEGRGRKTGKDESEVMCGKMLLSISKGRISWKVEKKDPGTEGGSEASMVMHRI